MEKKTIDALHGMLSAELDDMVKHGINTHEELDIVKDLLSSLKNLHKIERYMMEKMEKQEREDELVTRLFSLEGIERNLTYRWSFGII